MGRQTEINWCDSTFNPWIGCTKVSPGCAHCYAETLMDTRYGRVKWGAGQPRQRTSVANWKKPIQWNREQEKLTAQFGNRTPEGRPRVFCASLADWLDEEVPIEWLADLLALIQATPSVDWLLLTKRPQNWRAQIEAVFECFNAGERSEVGGARDVMLDWCDRWLAGGAPANVWIGTTVEDQNCADERIPELLKIPARIRFLSCEPLLERIDLAYTCFNGADSFGTMPGIHWVIAGGESGPGARPMMRQWVIDIRDQCETAKVAFLFKQWGGVNKAKTGRLLDGLTYDELPNAITA